MRGKSDRQSQGARVCTTDDASSGGESVLMTRLERESARMSCITASTTRPVLNMITRGRDPPADGSMNLKNEKKLFYSQMSPFYLLTCLYRSFFVGLYLRASSVMTRMMQTELLSLSLDESAG